MKPTKEDIFGLIKLAATLAGMVLAFFAGVLILLIADAEGLPL